MLRRCIFFLLLFASLPIAMAQPVVELTVGGEKCSSADLPKNLRRGNPMYTYCEFAHNMSQFMSSNDMDGTLQVDVKEVKWTISLLVTQAYRWKADFVLPNGISFETSGVEDYGWSHPQHDWIFSKSLRYQAETALMSQELLASRSPTLTMKLLDEFDSHLEAQEKIAPEIITQMRGELPDRRPLSSLLNTSAWTVNTTLEIVGNIRSFNAWIAKTHGLEQFKLKSPKEIEGCGWYLWGIPLY